MNNNGSDKAALDGLEASYLTGRMSRRSFVASIVAAGATTSLAVALADKAEAAVRNQAFNVSNLAASYDYIVCGAGSAGCVTASELARRKPDAKILLVEAGGPDTADGIFSLLWFQIYKNPDLFWSFQGSAEPHLNGRRPDLPMGRVIGGGSSVNALIYARGHKADYDGWAKTVGDSRWSYENVLKHFLKMEDYHGPASPLRGRGGLFYSAMQTGVADMARDLRAAGPRVGLPSVDDINAETMERDGGIGPTNIIAKDGQRISVAQSFLYPALSMPNLTVITGAYLQRISLEGKKATGVVVTWNGQPRTIKASTRVVLSLGALKTPQLLMLSGIGPSEHLAKFAIKTVANLPGVGENFHDHPLAASCAYEAPYDFAPKGNGSQCVYFSNVNSPSGAPDIMPVQIQIPFVAEAYAGRPDMPKSNLWTIVPGLAKPRSRGKLTLATSNATDAPLVQTNFLSDPFDLETLRLGLEQARELGASPEMKPHVKREVLPGPLDKKGMEDFIRNSCGTYYHMCGTAKMGGDGDRMAVVDSKLSVRGVDNLSIADTSIFPDIPRSNTMVPAAMVGYQLAEILTK